MKSQEIKRIEQKSFVGGIAQRKTSGSKKTTTCNIATFNLSINAEALTCIASIGNESASPTFEQQTPKPFPSDIRRHVYTNLPVSFFRIKQIKPNHTNRRLLGVSYGYTDIKESIGVDNRPPKPIIMLIPCDNFRIS